MGASFTVADYVSVNYVRAIEQDRTAVPLEVSVFQYLLAHEYLLAFA